METKEEKKDNLKVWNYAFKTDQKWLKSASNGRYNFTCVDAYYQIRVMTNMFGPYGYGWGVENEKYTPIANVSVLYTATLWYNYKDKRCEIPLHTDVRIISNNNKFQEDFSKKAATDALTKGFSMLGISADVFMGMHDGNKYGDNENNNQQKGRL